MNLLGDLYPKNPMATRYFELLEQKYRSPKIGGAGQFAEELKRNQRQKSSQRVVLNKNERSAREVRLHEYSQSFTNHIRNMEFENKSDKGYLLEERPES